MELSLLVHQLLLVLVVRPVFTGWACFGLLFLLFFNSIFWFLFVHESESKVIGLVTALFGKPSLWGHPWNGVDPIVIALPHFNLGDYFYQFFYRKN